MAHQASEKRGLLPPDHHRIGWARATASIRKKFQHAFKFSARQLIPA
jgi:hypothetical protein